MDDSARKLILEIMAAQPDLTLATLRPDGWPQATTVSYANDGLAIYFVVGHGSQKAANIRACPRVSATIDKPYADWQQIQGLSMAATAEIVTDPDEVQHAIAQFVRRFPQASEWADKLADVVFIKLTPKVISLLDYTKGFGHTDLIEL